MKILTLVFLSLYSLAGVAHPIECPDSSELQSLFKFDRIIQPNVSNSKYIVGTTDFLLRGTRWSAAGFINDVNSADEAISVSNDRLLSLSDPEKADLGVQTTCDYTFANSSFRVTLFSSIYH